MPETILIVEDDPLNLKLFKDVLRARGFRTVDTADGDAVLDLARAERPLLVVMDVRLAGSAVSGDVVVRRIKAAPDLAGIPVLVVTAFAMKGDRERIETSGCDAFLTKPISVREFVDSVEGLLKRAA